MTAQLLNVLDPEIIRLAYCPSCKSDNTVSCRNGDGHAYCRCLTCACRFGMR